MTITVDIVHGTIPHIKKEKIKLDGPGILDLAWYGMLCMVNMVSCRFMVQYHSPYNTIDVP